MSIEMDSSDFKIWSPNNVVVFERNVFSRNAIIDAVEKTYPGSNILCFDCFVKTIKFIICECDSTHSTLVIIEFSGDKNSPFLFFNAMNSYFSADHKKLFKTLIYTTVEDRFFISSMVDLISGGVVLKKESILSMKRVLYALKYNNQIVLSAGVSELLEDYPPPNVSFNELKGYFSEIGEPRLSLTSCRIGSKYKTFYSRRYSTMTKIGCKNVRQYSRYLSKIVGKLSE
ncbi:hypothetical protein [Serratia fonticola]|uniref:hypothetical protein n=1 Tax=Serratia fonticola TaxID=47917 RepID=UPI003BB77247